MQLEIDQPFDLAESLESGQAHRWKRLEDGWYSGVLGPWLIHIRQDARGVEYRVAGDHAEAETLNSLLRSYFRLDDDIHAIYAEICRDRRVAEMVARYPGLRILRQDPWECTVAFICSATSNIPRIHQNMEAMADSLGDPLELDGEVRHTFASAEQLASAGEGFLRELGLGFRAPYVVAAAQRVCDGELDLDELIRLRLSGNQVPAHGVLRDWGQDRRLYRGVLVGETGGVSRGRVGAPRPGGMVLPHAEKAARPGDGGMGARATSANTPAIPSNTSSTAAGARGGRGYFTSMHRMDRIFVLRWV